MSLTLFPIVCLIGWAVESITPHIIRAMQPKPYRADGNAFVRRKR